MRFRNPANGHIESKSAPGVWAFVFGLFYYLINGLWMHVAVQLVAIALLLGLFGPPGTLFVAILWGVYAAFAGAIVRNNYLRRGWVELGEEAEPTGAPGEVAPGFRKCPFCAEEIRAEAIKCRYCGSEVSPLPAPEPVVLARSTELDAAQSRGQMPGV